MPLAVSSQFCFVCRVVLCTRDVDVIVVRFANDLIQRRSRVSIESKIRGSEIASEPRHVQLSNNGWRV